jgi:hypothetical protein
MGEILVPGLFENNKIKNIIIYMFKQKLIDVYVQINFVLIFSHVNVQINFLLIKIKTYM